MNFKSVNKFSLHVRATNWLAQQNTSGIILPESVMAQGYLMTGEILTANGANQEWLKDNGVNVGDKILFTTIDRNNNLNCEPLENQKLLDDGEYLVWIHAILAKLSV